MFIKFIKSALLAGKTVQTTSKFFFTCPTDKMKKCVGDKFSETRIVGQDTVETDSQLFYVDGSRETTGQDLLQASNANKKTSIHGPPCLKRLKKLRTTKQKTLE